MMKPVQSNHANKNSPKIQYNESDIQQSKCAKKRGRKRKTYKWKPKKQENENEIVDLDYEEIHMCSIRNPPKKNEDANTIFKYLLLLNNS